MVRDFEMLVFSNPVAGREDEYNRWYDEVHLGEVVASSPEFTGARRCRLTAPPQGGLTHRYLAIYTARTEDPVALLAGLTEKSRSGTMNMSDAIDLEGVSILFAEQR